MSGYNPENERIKRRYFIFLKEAKQRSEASIDPIAKALNRFEAYTKFRSFKAFHHQQAIGFKNHLARQLNARTEEPLSKATAYSTLAALKSFFQWLCREPGFKRLSYSDADYFSMSLKDCAIAKAQNEKRIPTLEQIRHVLANMPAKTDIDRRNRAMIAFVIMTGARVDAVASMRLKHVDLAGGSVFQDAKNHVRTKFSKSFRSYFFPVGEDIHAIFAEWVLFLQTERLWSLDDPIFPAPFIALNAFKQFEAQGLDRKAWKTTAPIRKVFRGAFEAVGLPYFNPHSFRDTLTLLGEQLCRTPEEFKAWSQNFAHESVMTTFSSYGQVPERRQAEIIRLLGKDARDDETFSFSELAEFLSRRQSGGLTTQDGAGR